MTITIEELRNAYEDAELIEFESTRDEMQSHDAALLAVARFVAERQRAAEPDHNEIERYEGDGTHRQWGKHTTAWLYPGDRVWVVNIKDGSAVAPLVVPECPAT